ncbi:MAG: hypothetical protein K2X93_26145 [Candidatus Obscuribacterales bacterium]|nr:hypothetical protein [Candidatus Obscuribacterales bacterium]
MRNFFVLAILMISGLCANSAFALESKLSDLSWMVGQWQCKADSAEFEEHWMRASGDSMIGMGREVKDGKLAFHEYLRLEGRDDGIYYIAQPFGKIVTEYKLTKATPSVMLFENPDHDFPKKIEYSLQKDGSIFVTGSGDAADKDKEFRYHLMKMNLRASTDKALRTEKAEKTAVSEKTSKADPINRADKSDKEDNVDKAVKADKSDKSDKTDMSDKTKTNTKGKAKSGRFMNPIKSVNQLLF